MYICIYIYTYTDMIVYVSKIDRFMGTFMYVDICGMDHVDAGCSRLFPMAFPSHPASARMAAWATQS